MGLVNMNEQSGSYQDKLAALHQEYRKTLPLRLDEIDHAWQVVREQAADKESCQRLYHLAHSMAGSGTTFGYSLLSQEAKELEKLVHQVDEGEVTLVTAEPVISQQVFKLREASFETDEYDMTGALSLQKKRKRRKVHHIYWLSKDPELGERLCSYLHCFGFEVHHFTSFEALCAQISDRDPNLVVLDFYEADGHFTDTSHIMNGFGQLNTRLAIICICPPGEDLEYWLKAYRSGIRSCLEKPLDVYDLLEKIDSLTRVVPQPKDRLFIVDDDVELVNHMAAILEKAGMEVAHESNPRKVLQTLAEFSPDLILMDLYMRHCSGIELAQIIRRNDRYLGIPIVYLSQETDTGKQLEALNSGGDDFLFKPVKYRLLYHKLAARIKRAREMRAMMTRDSLTGLLNHTGIHECLHKEVKKALAANRPLAFVLIDIDDFKSLNDKMGHEVGDRLLKAMAILLQRMLPGMSIVGRYGGEEFAVILPGVTAEQALALFKDLCARFARTLHASPAGDFQESFSAGVAALPTFADACQLAEAADHGLTNAKITGKNKVVLMDTPVAETPAEPPLVEESTEIVTLDEDELEELDLADLEEALLLEEEEEAEKVGSILVVDDDQQLLRHICTVLEEKGFQVFFAYTGDEGYQLARKHKPNIALIDLLLFPGIHGFELCQKVRDDVTLAHTKIILMTAVYKDYRYRLEGKEAGADEFIEKPINYPQLFEKITNLLAKIGQARNES